MKRPGTSKAISAGGLVVLLVLAFAGHAFGQKKPKFAYVANQCGNVSCTGSGNVSGYAIDSTTGVLSPVPSSPFAAGLAPSSVAVDPSGKFAYVTNLNSNDVSGYTIDSTTGALSPITGSPFAAGLFPRSVAVDPSGQFAYVSNLNSNDVSAYTIDSTTGALSPVTGSPFSAGVFPSSVALDPSGKFAYVANLCGVTCSSGVVSANTINSTTGALSAVPGSPFTAGSNPFSVAVDPSGKFAYVANDSSNNVSAYTIDGTTGALSAVLGSPFAAGAFPVSVAIAGQSTVPFAAFRVKAEVDLDRKASFELEGHFRLGAGSNGINPLTEDVTLQVGTFSTTIPAGSFREEGRGTFEFEGFINGVALEVVIHHVRGNRFLFTAEGRGANLTGTVNSVTVELTIGDDGGSTMVTADIDR